MAVLGAALPLSLEPAANDDRHSDDGNHEDG